MRPMNAHRSQHSPRRRHRPRRARPRAEPRAALRSLTAPPPTIGSRVSVRPRRTCSSKVIGKRPWTPRQPWCNWCRTTRAPVGSSNGCTKTLSERHRIRARPRLTRLGLRSIRRRNGRRRAPASYAAMASPPPRPDNCGPPASAPEGNPRGVAADAALPALPDPATAAADENARAGIASALARYQAALEALDAAALESIYPAVPQGMLDALETYSTYEVELSDQPPVIAGDTATLGCRFPCA